MVRLNLREGYSHPAALTGVDNFAQGYEVFACMANPESHPGSRRKGLLQVYAAPK